MNLNILRFFAGSVALLSLVGCGGGKTYTVTFDYNDGVTESKLVKVKENNKVDKIDDPTRDGYRFDGWYNGDNIWDFDKDVVKGDTTLKATYSLTKVVSGSMLPDLTIKSNETVTITMDATSESGDARVFYSGVVKKGADKVTASAIMYNGQTVVDPSSSYTFDFEKGTPIVVRTDGYGTFATGNKLILNITNNGDEDVVLSKAMCCESDFDATLGSLTADVTVPVKRKNKIFSYLRNLFDVTQKNDYTAEISDSDKCLNSVLKVSGGCYDTTPAFATDMLDNFTYDSDEKSWTTVEQFNGHGCVCFVVQVGDISADKQITLKTNKVS